jgi:signal transduction histidine kinase
LESKTTENLQNILVDAIENISEAFVIYDADGLLVMCNQNFRNLYDYSEEEAKPGVHFRELGKLDIERNNVVVGDHSADQYLENKAKYREKLEGDMVVLLGDGRTIKTRDRKTSDGGFVSIQEDITAEQEKVDILNRTIREVDEANNAKSKFLANMSHELRTPLNSIIGFSQIIAEDSEGRLDARKYREYASDINASSTFLLELINDLLNISQIEAGEFELERSLVDLNETIEASVKMVRQMADRHELSLQYEPPTPSLSLNADSRHIRQVIINLLTNAIKFTPDRGQVMVNTRYTDTGEVEIIVRDTGVGIAAKDIPRILKPFGQVADSWTRSHDGVGLGLAISKDLMKLHGGDLKLESEVNQGTTVTLTFPKSCVVPSFL